MCWPHLNTKENNLAAAWFGQLIFLIDQILGPRTKKGRINESKKTTCTSQYDEGYPLILFPLHFTKISVKCLECI